MSENLTANTDNLNPDAIATYLRENPLFFNNYPNVLRELELPHLSGAAVSLWDRQLSSLREEHDRLKAKFDEFIVSARSNEALILRIHRLALTLMEAAGPQAVFTVLQQRLADDFNADQITVLLFADPAFVDSVSVPQFVGAKSPRREAFANVLKSRQTLCGRLTYAQGEALFGRTEVSGSHVVLPLATSQWDGLIVITSTDPSRFDVNMGTEFLAYLRDVVALVIDPWVAKSNST
ncbi:MAG: DUF484 family protein [Gammaproteobacteria bacterium]|nr:DUF484 family protein [Gammaproteobacteria bacterium]